MTVSESKHRAVSLAAANADVNRIRPGESTTSPATRKRVADKAVGDKADDKADDKVDDPADQSRSSWDKLMSMTDGEILIARQYIMSSDSRFNLQRKPIEARLEPMDFGDMLELYEVRQTVPVRADGRLNVVFRSMAVGGMDEIDQALSIDIDNPTAKSMAARANAVLVLSIVSINDVILPDHRRDGKWDADLYTRRLAYLQRLPAILARYLELNRQWFLQRLETLTKGEGREELDGLLKNG